MAIISLDSQYSTQWENKDCKKKKKWKIFTINGKIPFRPTWSLLKLVKLEKRSHHNNLWINDIIETQSETWEIGKEK